MAKPQSKNSMQITQIKNLKEKTTEDSEAQMKRHARGYDHDTGRTTPNNTSGKSLAPNGKKRFW